MDFEWDERKRETNVAKHGLDFLDAANIFDGRPQLTLQSRRGDELRFVTIAELHARHVTLVWTWRGDAIRIISARRARSEEEKAYDTHIG